MQELKQFLANPLKFVRRSIRRIIRKLPAARGVPIPSGFFDGFTRFYSTSVTGGSPNRLNQRYLACIKWNKAAIQGKRILDLASHDGRWSFAAIKAGATNVVGIEARDHLVQAAVVNLREYGVADNSFRFVWGIFSRALTKSSRTALTRCFVSEFFITLQITCCCCPKSRG
jgi:hypothetical protein